MKNINSRSLWASAFVILTAHTALSAQAEPLRTGWLSLSDMGLAQEKSEPTPAPQQARPPSMGYTVPEETPLTPMDNTVFPEESQDPLLANTSSNTTPLLPEDLSDMVFKALERQDWALAQHYAQQLALMATTDKARYEAAYGLALSLMEQEKYEDALKALHPLENADRAFQDAANKLAGTLHLHIAELALLTNNTPLAERYLNAYEYYANTHANPARAERLKRQLSQSLDHTAYLRVGVLLPLTGAHASIGKGLLKAMQEAVFTQEASKVVLYPIDTGSDAQGAVDGLAKLDTLHVDAIIGPLLSPQVDALKKSLPQNHVPILALSSDPHVAAPGVHLFSYRPDQQARLVARHAVSLGRTRLAALVPSTPYGYEVFDAFRDEAATLGAEITVTNFYNPDKPDISGALETLLQLDLARKNLQDEKKALQAEYAELGNALPDEKLARLKEIKKAKPEAVVDFDALFLPARAEELSLITSQMAVYDLDRQDVLLLGTTAWDSKAIRTQGDYVREGRFPALPDHTAFDARFTEDFNMPPSTLSALGFDAVRILADAARQPGQLAQNLLRSEGFPGVGGAVRFHPNGLTERAYALKNLHAGQTSHVKHAPILLPPELPIPLNPSNVAPIWRYSPW